MLVVERHREIAALIKRERSVRVRRLAQQFDVTQETIRRDLEKLEAEGIVIRSHGGAVIAPISGRETHYKLRASENVQEKRVLAKRATQELENGDTILLDASTTALEMATALPDIDLTVLTNSISICLALAERQTIKVICVGGSLSRASLSFVGPQAERSLEGYHVNRYFFSCTGVDFRYGLSDINESQALLKRKMLDIAGRTYLLFDSSKLGGKALHRFCGIGDVSTIVTTANLTPENLEQLAASGVDLITAERPR